MNLSIADKHGEKPSALDINKLRDEFPVLSQLAHNKPLVYLDNAATTQKPIAVINAIDEYYKTYNSNVHRGVHALSSIATMRFEAAREKVKNFVNASSIEEIIFTRGTTESINLMATSYGRTFLTQGDEIIISHMEHHANIVPWQMLCEQTGAILKVIPMNTHGELLLEEYEKLLSDKTKIVSISHISNALGTINPIKDMIAKAKQVGAITMIDGAQAAPHAAIDVMDLQCDFYAFSGHKMYAPTGIGVLYGKKALLEKMPPYQGGGEMIKHVSFDKTIYNDLPHKFEAGTPHIAGVIGLGTAIDFLNSVGLENIANYEKELLAYATKKAENTEGLKIIGHASEKVSILSFVLDYAHAHDVGTILDTEGIAVRSGHHCAMPAMAFFDVAATVRASFCFYNTKAEVDTLFDGITKVKELFG